MRTNEELARLVTTKGEIVGYISLVCEGTEDELWPFVEIHIQLHDGIGSTTKRFTTYNQAARWVVDTQKLVKIATRKEESS